MYSSETNAEKQPQKIIIPRGVVNPDETTVIEVPARLKRNPVVVARNPRSTNSDKSQTRLLQSSLNGRDVNTSSLSNKTIVFAPTSSTQTMRPASTYSQFSPVFTSESKPSLNLEDLYETEKNEKLMLQRDLEEFQKARRKLLENINTIATKPNTIFRTSSSSSYNKKSKIVCPKCGTAADDFDEEILKNVFKHSKDSCPLEKKPSKKDLKTSDNDICCGTKRCKAHKGN